jgi:N-acetylglucosaminyldiphosphoundecaprenol N-acetyl-beta-D-mannosaminyltransferase
MPRDVDAVQFMGVRIDNVGYGDVCRSIEENKDKPGHICVNDVGNVVAAAKDPELFEAIERSLLTVADGMPLAWYARLLGCRRIERITGFDLMQRLLARRNGWRHFLLGDTDDTIARVIAKARKTDPALTIAGHSPPFTGQFTDEENAAIFEQINRARPDVIWVSFGGGKQEKWMSVNLSRLDRGVMIGVGAAFRFYIGQLYVPPRIIQTLGLQWFFRMLSDPVRWFKRPFRRKIAFALHAPLEITKALRGSRVNRENFPDPGDKG